MYKVGLCAIHVFKNLLTCILNRVLNLSFSESELLCANMSVHLPVQLDRLESIDEGSFFHFFKCADGSAEQYIQVSSISLHVSFAKIKINQFCVYY